ncbi:transcription-repair coupling factor [Entomospira entomophila]|uniref:Transcription-repair-coupling factor n=1 Tax=Entomospira entomophila TaxID=2719988 RepID=A0A968KTA5_9SPIO|nr:transcription-repair coupling factor [Entomospira entomophilus]NIZ41222.1 transcription-repair coupling factor [Entomospira entomophilus]WDI35428.1 transcription-repair coupling factor [Entomospira entomophilus]
MITHNYEAFLKQIHESKDVKSLYDKIASHSDTDPIAITGLKKAWLAFFLKISTFRSPPIIITPSQQHASHLREDLKLLGVHSLTFDSIQHRIYDPSHSSGDRLSQLSQLFLSQEIVIIPIRTLMLKVIAPESLLSRVLSLNINQNYDTHSIVEQLVSMGYSRTNRVLIHGEFAVRGEIIDIFPHAKSYPFRLQFDFETLESIKRFDPEDQRSLESIPTLDVPPIYSLPVDDTTSYEEIRQKWRSMQHDQALDLSLEEFQQHVDLFALMLDKNQDMDILRYLQQKRPIFLSDFNALETVSDTFQKEVNALYKEAVRAGQKIPKPESILFSWQDLTEKLFSRAIILKNFTDLKSEHHVITYEESRSFFGNINFLKEELQQLHKTGYRIAIFSENEQQALRIETLLGDTSNYVTIFPFEISAGFTLPQAKVVAICEHEIFGRKRREIKHNTQKIESSVIDSFVDLNPGDHIVHVNYGVGLFKGIERMNAGGSERDYITLEYFEGDLIFVPIEQVNLVQRYIGSSGEKPRLDKIGGRSWSQKKSRARKSAEELSGFLVDLYAKREASRGFAFTLEDPMLMSMERDFEAHFPYQETEDQLTVMEEIKADMQQIKPMDRLVCGDVGYGKTELAMRSAFRAVLCGKQCAVLCPTTILAEQHYENFLKRFAAFDFINIKLLSRTVDRKTQKKTLEELASGQIDIIIGTHRILSKDLQFRNLGLLIIDEEQRFGVKDKEKVKNLKADIDCLTLSATPIPRTLHMSLVKIRDLSMLKTPPANRKPVETYVSEFNADLIAKAIRKELARGGQIFYLHNRVESLESIRQFLCETVPEASIEFAHGKMTGDEMDEVMHRFINGGFQVLLSTTIIESGIDIPNVNTIIIDRADMYGVSQLYQLRGRVGRSDRLAYAYLFYPEKSALSELAMKRLQIISDFTELGSGFKIAMKDMEVRGAGNLLGPEQSGEIQSVGFDLYLKLLDEAIRSRIQDEPDIIEPYLELEYSGFIPDSYINSSMEKMEIYKKIAVIETAEEIESLHAELLDRFGTVPDEVYSLISLAEIRVLCRRLRISSIKERNGWAEVEFSKLQMINFAKLMRIIHESHGKLKPSPSNPAAILLETGRIGLKEKSEFIRDRLQQIIA